MPASTSLRRAAARRTTAADRAWIVEQYQSGLGPRAIEKMGNWSRQTIERTLRNSGIPLRGCQKPIWNYYRDHPDELLALYEECEREMTIVAERLGVTLAAVHTFFTRAGLPRRSRKEAGSARGGRMRKGTGKRAHIAAEIAARVRDRCAFPECGVREHLQLHHLNGDRSDSREENLVALCIAHHLVIEFFIAKATDREGELDAVVLEHKAKVHTVYKPAAADVEEAA